MTPRFRRVQKIKIETLTSEAAKRVFTCASQPLRSEVRPPHLSDEMELVSRRRASATQHPTDRSLVSIRLRKIEEAVAGLQCDPHRLFDIHWRCAGFVG
jgi:hypothetical protein